MAPVTCKKMPYGGGIYSFLLYRNFDIIGGPSLACDQQIVGTSGQHNTIHWQRFEHPTLTLTNFMT